MYDEISQLLAARAVPTGPADRHWEIYKQLRGMKPAAPPMPPAVPEWDKLEGAPPTRPTPSGPKPLIRTEAPSGPAAAAYDRSRFEGSVMDNRGMGSRLADAVMRLGDQRAWPEVPLEEQVSRGTEMALGFAGPVKGRVPKYETVHTPNPRSLLGGTKHHFDTWGPYGHAGSGYAPTRAQAEMRAGDAAFTDYALNPRIEGFYWAPDPKMAANIGRERKFLKQMESLDLVEDFRPPQMGHSLMIGGKRYTQEAFNKLPEAEQQRLIMQFLRERSRGL